MVDPLLSLCTKYVSKNLQIYKSDNYLERLPPQIKKQILKYVTRVLNGFHDDVIFGSVLCKDVTKLNLNESTVTDISLALIASHCPKLKRLRLCGANYCFTQNGLFDSISKLNELELLEISSCQYVTDDFVELIATCCPKLKLFNLNGCTNITDNCVRHLSRTKITRLNLANTQITNKFLKDLGSSRYARTIEEINVSNCNITGYGLHFLRWDTMKYIGFSGCNVGDLSFMSNTKNLQFVEWTIPK